MKPVSHLKHEFVEFIPEELEDGTLYVSFAYTTVVHKCCCGCGNEVVTPLSPTDWKLIFDGESISLDPSIGNWSMACQSHYWIEDSIVRWAPRWSREQIDDGRERDRQAKQRYFEDKESDDPSSSLSARPSLAQRRSSNSFWVELKKRWWS
jgi:Family of unknown function (DUF6527)